MPEVLVIPVGLPELPEPSKAASSIAIAIDCAKSFLIKFSTSIDDWIINCLVTSVNAPRVFGDIVTEPTVNSDSPAAPPSELMNAALEAAVFLGIFTSPLSPLSIVAIGITAELFLRTSMKSPAL